MDYTAILNRLKEVLSAKSDSDVARGLGVTTAALSSFKKQGKFPYERLVKFCLAKNISIDWLLTGEGVQSREKRKEVMPDHESDTKLTGLINKLVSIYKEGTLKDRAEVRGIIEEVYDELKPGKEKNTGDAR